ncbi:HAMP domain-containing sensor histidine kinase [Hydrogenobacter sp. T-2]|uniref:sensor histidine kinase n=1 Tax=Pampinifervens diazotrophicum TaxID=1632018 RepID=UPI002B25A12F|nr:HAMP domain-containing sensor histidine kinase [Hydrogenobacter sp. T-2]WPM33012.1 HAMP domain-containing sensor histidine kinase [Hydrogenobacter sp. T-2]
MEYQVNPLLDFYKNYYQNPDYYAKLLAEDVVSREIASILIDEEGQIVKKESFLEGEMPEIELQDIRTMLEKIRGIKGSYAFIVKRVGDHHLILLGKLDSIRNVEKHIILFTTFILFLISLPASFLAFYSINQLLKPLDYLTEASRRISKGDLNLEIRKSGRKDEFGLLEEAYASMVERLKSIILWQREFIRNVAHALKTPLAYIKGQADLLQRGKYTEEELKEIYRNIQLQAEKMGKLINQLTTIMRLESQVPLKVEEVSLNQIFAELEEEYEFIRGGRRFTVEYLDEDVVLYVDKEYFKMAIRNLIENAYKYTEEGQEIRLYFKEHCVVVEDRGIGMEHPERAGELFYREAADKEGSGLGLYIVKLIAQRSGMSMKVESQKGVGTKVSLCYNFKL